MAGAGELADDALGVGAFRHALDEAGGHLAGEGLLDLEPADIVAVGPAIVAGRPDIDEADLERLLRSRRGGGPAARPRPVAAVPSTKPRRRRWSVISLFSLVMDGVVQVAGRKGLPRQAGASSLPRTEPAEMMVSTRMVAR